ncbi:MAG TPA: hypothetical protein VGP47_07840 [Parachlamydiaceae bacterium]|nr:hypothetical protein [Parachlamydiaceae bacterium]
MNTFNNPIPPSADSDWKYNLGEGFTRLHVEIHSDKYDIQLQHQSFWETVTNPFLNLLHMKPNEPRIKDNRIITIQSSSPNNDTEDTNINVKERVSNIQKNIFKLRKNIQENIFKMQKTGISPSKMENELIIALSRKTDEAEIPKPKAKTPEIIQENLNHGFPPVSTPDRSQMLQKEEMKRDKSSESSSEDQTSTFTEKTTSSQQEISYSESKSKEEETNEISSTQTSSTSSSQSKIETEKKEPSQPTSSVGKSIEQTSEKHVGDISTEGYDAVQEDISTDQKPIESKSREEETKEIPGTLNAKIDSHTSETESEKEIFKESARSDIDLDRNEIDQGEQQFTEVPQNNGEPDNSVERDNIFSSERSNEEPVTFQTSETQNEDTQTGQEISNQLDSEIDKTDIQLTEKSENKKAESNISSESFNEEPVTSQTEETETEQEVSNQEASSEIEEPNELPEETAEQTTTEDFNVEQAVTLKDQETSSQEIMQTDDSYVDRDETTEIPSNLTENTVTTQINETEPEQANETKHEQEISNQLASSSEIDKPVEQLLEETENILSDDPEKGIIEKPENNVSDGYESNIFKEFESSISEESEKNITDDSDTMSSSDGEEQTDMLTDQQPNPQELSDEPDQVVKNEENNKTFMELKDSAEPLQKSDVESLLTEESSETSEENAIEQTDDNLVLKETEEIEKMHTVSDLTNSEDVSKTDSSIKTFMTYVGYGLIVGSVVVVGVAASIFLSGGMVAFLGRGGAPLTVDDTALSINHLQADLREVCASFGVTQASLSHRCAELDLDLNLLRYELGHDSSEPNLIKLAKRIEIASSRLKSISHEQIPDLLIEIGMSPNPSQNPKLYSLMAKALKNSILPPEKIEVMLVTTLEIDKKMPIAANFKSDQKVYFVDIANKLFKMQKGEMIVEKVLELYFSPDINPENVVFLQQILESAIEKGICRDKISEALSNRLYLVIKKPKRNRDFIYTAEEASLNKLAKMLESRVPGSMGGYIFYLEVDEIKEAIWDLKSSQKGDNKVLNLINKNANLNEIDNQIAEELFTNVNYGTKNLDDNFVQITNSLFKKDSGYQILRMVLKSHSKGEESPILKEILLNAINNFPTIITKGLLSDKFAFAERIFLQEMILESASNEDLELYADSFKNFISSDNKISQQNIQILQKFTDQLPDTLQKIVLGQKISTLDSSPLQKHFFNYKSDAKTLNASYEAISNAISSLTNNDLDKIKELDKFLSQLIADNQESKLPNSEIFDENNTSNVFNLIQQLHEKGPVTSTLKSLTKSFLDPNLSHLASANLNLITNLIKVSSKESIGVIHKILGLELFRRVSPAKFNDNWKKDSFVNFKQFESDNLNKILRTSLNRYNEIGTEIEEQDYFMNWALKDYLDIDQTQLSIIKNPSSAEMIKTCIELLPSKSRNLFIETLLETYRLSDHGFIKDSAFPSLHEFYEQVDGDNKKEILDLALREYLNTKSENARGEFEKIITSAAQKIPTR